MITLNGVTVLISCDVEILHSVIPCETIIDRKSFQVLDCCEVRTVHNSAHQQSALLNVSFLFAK